MCKNTEKGEMVPFKVFFILCAFLTICCALECSDPDSFMCQDRTCIKSENVCDGNKDCPDNSDEKDCDYKLCKKPEWYKCKDNRTCIKFDFLCDGQENCPWGDDEDNCDSTHQHPKCTKFEFTCTDNSCIPLDMVCDGKRDCSDNSDEVMGCIGIEERCHGFLCVNKHCLESHTWVCDGHDDCGDGSDEIGCVTNCKLEDHRFLCHDNQTCISLDKVCDNTEDCDDHSDEGATCKKSECSSALCPSPSECHKLPQGPTCICPKGFYFDEKKKQCMDIDECQNYAVCSQGCQNTEGSYTCTCAEKFVLEKDKKTCSLKAGEPLLLYSTQKAIVGIYLKSRHSYHIAANLSQVIGVDYDGHNVYWTDIKHQSESIVRAREDGSNQEIVLTSGLEAPEDLAVDWLTGNIYFSDNMLKHIAVCSNNGYNCVVLIVKDVDQPRGLVLNPLKGVMYWTDWGQKPHIGRASMDGNNATALVSEDIHWPNGIALDLPNGRIYWVDAKLGKIESIRTDGKDRRIVLKDILKHPYGIAVFEDRLYWSDWGTKSIHSCHKFSGKHHEILAKDRTIYDVHIYHSALQPKINHTCMSHKCSHICLLAENNNFSCACPEGMALGVDYLTCKKVTKKQHLFLGVGNYLVRMEHTSFGKHKMADGLPLPIYIHKMVFNTLNGSVIIADNVQKVIYSVHPGKKTMNILVQKNLGNVTALQFDHLANNLYWTDSQRHTVEVLSLQNMERAIVHHFSGTDIPVALAVIPEQGKMFIALQSSHYVHIDVQRLHGRGYHHHLFEEHMGTKGIQFFVEPDTEIVFWLDSGNGKIEFTNFEGSFRHLFRTRLSSPVSMTLVDDDIVWSSFGSKIMHYTHRSNLGSVKRFELEMSQYIDFPDEIALVASRPLYSVDHICLHNNGGCSHVCVALGKHSAACLCPPGLVFKDLKNMTCIEALDCEFRCDSGECLTLSRRCNGRKDCADGSDERQCGNKNTEKGAKVCSFDQFACHDGSQCIPNIKRCDQTFDCSDRSDEEHCENFDHRKKCHEHQYACDNGRCVDLSAMCDSFDDCGDRSDEKDCNKGEDVKSVCGDNMFKCTSGPCIPQEWECDGHLDCVDGSDEHDKCVNLKCPAGLIKCHLGQCIDEKLACDGHNDCGDNSDEAGCDAKIRQIVCGDAVDFFGDPTKFQCPSDPMMCLDIKVRCNGSAECPRGEDEVGCSGCSINEFQCRSDGECIRKEFQCDSQKDCNDGSDEIDCQNYNVSTHGHFATLCHDGMFHCKEGTCVDQLRVCDGYRDCESGDDESPTCQTACTHHPCEQKCTPSPHGAVCSCNSGYQLNGDRKTCSDINECVEGNPCAQICENSYGSYRCSCYPGFMLRADKVSCKSIEAEHSLIFTSFNQVRKLSENPIALKILWSLNDTRITGLDVNVRAKKAYFSIQDSQELFEFNLENETIRSLFDVGSKGKIAVDWITGNIYVVDYLNRYSIKVCDFDNVKVCVDVIKFTTRDVVKSLAVDAVRKQLFYVVVYFHTFGDPKSIIYKSGLDGSRQEVIASIPSFVTAIECDTYKEEVYFMDRHTKTLQAVGYNGGQPRIVIKKENAITNPSGLSIYENVAFIVNIGSPEAVKCNLFGDFSCQAFNLNVYNSEDIKVVGPSRQKLVKNVCENNNCSVMCVPAELGAKCLCHDGTFTPPGVACSNFVQMAVVGTFHSSEESSINTTALGICLTLIILILFGVGGYLYYRRRSARGKFNVNMHFQNPLERSENIRDNIEHGASKLYQPIQKLLQGGKVSEISLETGKKDTFKSLQAAHDNPGSVDDSDNESSRDVGNFDDNPRARLVL